jgi:hypothetical protein
VSEFKDRMIPDGKHYVEARQGDLVVRLFFEWRTVIPPDAVEGFEAGCYRIGWPKLVALWPRPMLLGVDDQADGYRIDGRSTFVDELPDEMTQRAVEALPDLDAVRAVLESLLDRPVPDSA